MNRLGKLPENQFITTLTELSSEIDAFRNTQRISGQGGVLGYYQQSNDPWDYTDTVGSNAGSSIDQLFQVMFTDDGSRDLSMTNLTFLVFANGTDPAHQITPQSPAWTDGTRSATASYGSLVTSQHSVAQNFSLLFIKQVTFYIKAFATSSSQGTVSVTLLP